MDYNHITNFLERFKKILFQGEGYKKVISETITKHISSSIEPEIITTKGASIHIQGSPMLRNEILIHKQGILKDLSDLLPDRHFTDIR